MYSYILKRILLFIPTIIIVSVIVFLIMRLIPGDPAIQILSGDLGDASYTEDDLAILRAKLGTDKPIFEQYYTWTWNMLQLDFGKSFQRSTRISDDLKKKFPITMELTILAMIMAVIIAVPMGVISAVNQDKPIDYVARIIANAGVAFPTFWTGIILITLLVLWFDYLAPLGYVDLWDDPLKNLQQLIFPAIALGFFNMAFIARVTRSAMLDVFREDYIRTARSKGLREPTVVNRHALKNALLPVITVSGYEFGRLLAGTVIIEVIFMIPGVGRFLIDSIFHRDYPAIQALIVILAMIVLVLNLILDVMYAWLNPRIRYS